jgi:uncharacterized protein YijF (DUF1287 family)
VALVAAALPILLMAIRDRGILPDLGQSVRQPAPAPIHPAEVWLRVDPAHGLVTIYQGEAALAVYAAGVSRAVALARPGRVAGLVLSAGDPDVPARAGVVLAAGDLGELERATPPDAPVVVGAPERGEDRDGDGIVDPLDILRGAKKLLGNHAQYRDRYVEIPYPGGDVPRSEGVCTDVIIRALRNAGIDLQREVHEDLARARAAYPMVEKIDASINHRRVRTVVRWFERHFEAISPQRDFQSGDVVFFDTFPDRPGPEHLGIVSDRAGPCGRPMIINHWTVGTAEAEMDLLGWVGVTHHFRVPGRRWIGAAGSCVEPTCSGKRRPAPSSSPPRW